MDGMLLTSARATGTLLDHLAEDLSARFGRGFWRANVASMRLFYLIYRNDIVQTLSGQSGRSKKIQTASGQSELAQLAARDSQIPRTFYRPDLKFDSEHAVS